MKNSSDSSGQSGNTDVALDTALRLTFVALIVFWCAKIVAPFFLTVLWGLVIAVAFYPVFLKLEAVLGGRGKLAGGLFIVVGLAVVLLPTIWLTESIVEGATKIGHGLQDGTLEIPQPSESVKGWPAVGEKLHGHWTQAATDLEDSIARNVDQLKALGGKIVDGVASLGGAVVQTVFAIILAGIFMINAVGGGRLGYALADRLGGEKGRELVDISISTIRSVVKGVLLVALIQSLLAAIGLVFAGVPAPGLWAFAVLVLAIVQLPPILILGPIAAYVFSASDSTAVSVVFLIWSLVVSFSDGILKPMLLGRGVAVPMLVILVGAIGGMIAAGVIGLFLGAVILSIGYTLILAWLGDSLQKEKPASAPTD